MQVIIIYLLQPYTTGVLYCTMYTNQTSILYRPCIYIHIDIHLYKSVIGKSFAIRSVNGQLGRSHHLRVIFKTESLGEWMEKVLQEQRLLIISLYCKVFSAKRHLNRSPLVFYHLAVFLIFIFAFNTAISTATQQCSINSTVIVCPQVTK